MNGRKCPIIETGSEVGIWLLFVLGIGGFLVHNAEERQETAPATLVVSSHLHDSVMVDVRTRSRTGSISGPVAKPLRPGSRVEFLVNPDRALCLRIVETAGPRITPLYLPATWSEGGPEVRIRESTLNGVESAQIRCDPELEKHRVRVALGKYFEPDDPGRIRREPILVR
ncbi:MAG: hypothetical protein GEU90_08180 [Gemmatimonas sp.]|nr:hypothetical protein [Gemmatimonas sp.]